MTSSTQNVKVGVCRISFGGTDLGFTQGGVEVEVKTETHQVMVDQFGKSIINEIILGRTVSVKAPLAETTLQNLVSIMPGATLVGTGSNMKVNVPVAVGQSLVKTAKQLILHPKELPDADLSEDFCIPLANTSGALQFAYQLEKERIFNVTFNGYPDPVSGKLFSVGNETTSDPT